MIISAIRCSTRPYSNTHSVQNNKSNILSFGMVRGNLGCDHAIDLMAKADELRDAVYGALSNFKDKNFSLRLGEGFTSINLYDSDELCALTRSFATFKGSLQGFYKNEDVRPLAAGKLVDGEITDQTISSLINGIADMRMPLASVKRKYTDNDKILNILVNGGIHIR